MSAKIRGVGPNPKQLHFFVQLPEYGLERLTHVTVCHHMHSPPHHHSTMQVMWVLGGELQMLTAGKLHRLLPGTLIALPADFPHQPMPPHQHPEVEMLDLRVFPPLSDYLALKIQTLTARFPRRSTLANVQRLSDLCKNNRNPDPASVMAEIWSLMRLAGGRKAMEPAPATEDSADARIHAAEAVMRLYLSKPLSIHDLADQVNLSSTHLTRLFQEVRKVPPGVVFRRMRLGRAQELLTGTCLSVKEVGIACGFVGINQFVRAFGREFSVSPGEFRKHGRSRRKIKGT